MIKIRPKWLFIFWIKHLKRFMSLNFLCVEARAFIKIILEKFKERSCKGAKSDRWLSSGKESTVNHSFDCLTFSGTSWLKKRGKYSKNSMDQIWCSCSLLPKISEAIYEVKWS